MSRRGQTFECQEGKVFFLPATHRAPFTAAASRVKRALRPRLGGLFESDGGYLVRGIIGTIDLGQGARLEVSPKVEKDWTGDEWISSVLRLLLGSDRIEASGERAATLSPPRRNLLDVLATQFASRLECALHREGPILLLRRQQTTLGHVKGKLQVGRWLRAGPQRAHRFPVAYNELVADHAISGALADVGGLFVQNTSVASVRLRLIKAVAALRPGCGRAAPASRAVVSQALPTQWAAFEPAWAVARAVILQRSLLGAAGTQTGISVALEAWPLLERLLERCLQTTITLARATGRTLEMPAKSLTPFLVNPTGTAGKPHPVVPDGTLVEHGQTRAIFEAKYKRRAEIADWPDREDYFQAVATASACDAPLAVLVYPERFAPARWEVWNHAGKPLTLVAVGLGLYSCITPAAEEERARMLLDLLPPAG